MNIVIRLAPPKPKKKKAKTAAEAAPFVPPTQAYVYVETEYPAWRMELLAALTNIFEANGKSFPKTTIKDLMPVPIVLRLSSSYLTEFTIFLIVIPDSVENPTGVETVMELEDTDDTVKFFAS